MQETADESSELRGLVQRDGRLELSPGTEDKASRSCSFMYGLWSPCGDTWGTPPGLHHQSQKPLCLAGAGGLPDQRKGGIRVRTWPRPGGPMMQCLRPGRDHRPRFLEFWEMQGYHLRRKRRRSSSTWTRTFAVLVRIPSVLVVLWTAIRMCRSPSTTGDGSG